MPSVTPTPPRDRLLRRPVAGRPCLVSLPFLVLWVVLCGSLAVGCRNPLDSNPHQRVRPAQASLARDANLIVVSFDALRADALGAYGGDRGATPHMDAFAAESRIYDHAYSVAPRTPMSFAGFFSGRLPTRVFIGWRFRAQTTMAGLLSEAGYSTAAYVNNVQLTADRHFDRGFQTYECGRSKNDGPTLEKAMTWLAEHRDRKLFLWLHLLRPHAPYRDRPAAHFLYRQKETGSFPQTTDVRFEATDPVDIGRIRDLYFGEVWAADQLFGRVLDRLRSLDLMERSIVVLTSDHGEELADHGGFQHGRLYQEHLHIPLMLHHPAIPGGVRVEQPVRSVDLLPTLLALVGHPVEAELDGEDLMAGSEDGPRPVVAVSMTGKFQAMSVLEGDSKLIERCKPVRELRLYELARDPHETVDLTLKDPDRARRLRAELQTIVGGRPCPTIRSALQGVGSESGLPARTVETLRSLGYGG